jgi:hypothetical protein
MLSYGVIIGVGFIADELSDWLLILLLAPYELKLRSAK